MKYVKKILNHIKRKVTKNTAPPIKRGKRVSFKEYHPSIKEYFIAEKNNDTSHPEVKRIGEYIRKGVIKKVNEDIEKSVKDFVPELKLTQRFVEQIRYAARKTSQHFNTDLEVSGVCSGRRSSNGIYLDQFHIFHDQVCSSVRTEASGFGMISTYWSLDKKKLKPYAQGHSHNKMSTFHSGTDLELLRQGAQESSIPLEGRLRKFRIPVECFYNVVFNHNTALYTKKRNLPHVRASMKLPYLTLDGKVAYKKTVHIFEPRWKMCPYKKATQEDKNRLDKEIATRVRRGF